METKFVMKVGLFLLGAFLGLAIGVSVAYIPVSLIEHGRATGTCSEALDELLHETVRALERNKTASVIEQLQYLQGINSGTWESTVFERHLTMVADNLREQ